MTAKLSYLADNLGKLFNGMSDNTLSPPPRQKALGPSKSDPTDDDSSD